jgi:hypothetical protein
VEGACAVLADGGDVPAEVRARVAAALRAVAGKLG